jgi:hypothetical protein
MFASHLASNQTEDVGDMTCHLVAKMLSTFIRNIARAAGRVERSSSMTLSCVE